MSTFFPKKKLIIFILATLCIWAGGGLLIYYFVVRDIKDLSNEIVEKRQELNKLDYNASNFDKFSADYEKVAPDVSLINETFLDQASFIVFIQKLEKIAQETDMVQKIDLEKKETPKKSAPSGEEGEDSKVKSKEAAPSRAVEPLVYRLNLEGSFPNFVKYLQSLENLNYYTNPRLASFTLKNKETKTPGSPLDIEPQAELIQASIEAEVYTTNISN
ncbi:MAG: hypothetical protein WC650_04040 [Candidatus Doudnabacteria bacterium]